MKVIFTFLFTLLAGSTIYLINQQKGEFLGFSNSNCYNIRDDFPIATAENPNPKRTLSIYNTCYRTSYYFKVQYEDFEDYTKKELTTPCIKNNEQVILPAVIPEQIQYVYRFECKRK